MVAESIILAEIRLALSRGDVRLLRNNCGKFQDIAGRWISFGVGSPGGADLLGWKTVTITPDLVGTKVAIFTAMEVKSERGRLSEDQRRFLDAVRGAGGIAGGVKCLTEAYELLGMATS